MKPTLPLIKHQKCNVHNFRHALFDPVGTVSPALVSPNPNYHPLYGYPNCKKWFSTTDPTTYILNYETLRGFLYTLLPNPTQAKLGDPHILGIGCG